MPMYHLIGYSVNYSKSWGVFWQYYIIDLNATITDSFKSNEQIAEINHDDGISKNVEIAVSLKYLSNFWRTFEMPLINRKTNLILEWVETCVITNSTGVGTFAITGTRLCFCCSFINPR